MQNVVALTGRLTKDVEVRTFESGDRSASFSLAVQRNYKNKNGEYDADFFPCKARNGTADLLQKYFGKGSMVPVTGELKMDKYVDKDGNNRSITYVDVKSVTFVNGGKKEEVQSYDSRDDDNFPTFDAPEDSDDLPF